MKLALILLLLSTPLFSKTQLIWNTNKDHSSIRFKVRYLSFSDIEGKFKDFWGRIYFDDDGELPRKIEFSIEPSSVDTGSRIRDGHLRSSDFFSIKKYPTIRFQSSKVLAEGPNEFSVMGEIFLKGQTIPKEIKINLSPTVLDSWGFKNRFVNFKTSLSRKVLGLDWNRSLKGSTLLVGDLVELKGSLQIQPLNHLTPPSKHMIPTSKKSLNKTEKIKLVETVKTKTPSLIKPIMISRSSEINRTSKEQDYPLILAILVIVQLGFFGLKNVFSLIKSSRLNKKIQNLSLVIVTALALWSGTFLIRLVL